MNGLFRSAWVIARRDFVATVFSRSFILFLLAPLLIFGFSLLAGLSAGRAEREASRPTVAVIADSATVQALSEARARIVAGTSERTIPVLRPVEPADHVEPQARRLLADDEARLSGVFTGTIERPVLIAPPSADAAIGNRIGLLVEEARRSAALDQAGFQPQPAAPQRVVTETAAGDLRSVRSSLAQGTQMLIFMVTLMLATLLLSNLVEEKSNKVIEVLAAAVPLDSIFLGKLIAMLLISLVGLAAWGAMLGTAYVFVQSMQNWMALPAIAPATGWPVFILLVMLYYTSNYMLLGALFLGIGGQASSIREVQTLSMPITFLQLGVLLLAMNTVGSPGTTLAWTAYIVPFSSPLSMVAMASEQAVLWPHLAALAWQALWVVLIIRASAALFRRTVLKSGSRGGFWKSVTARR
ncbi:MAG: type transport system permease protein [Sphingomonadales bacterium]|nr:type transport system permease protein [Sphingomonadales bacterium]